MELRGTLISSQSGPGRPLGVLFGSLLRLRKRLRSDSLQCAKTFKFIVRYCKIQGPGRLESVQIMRDFLKNQRQTVRNRKLIDILSKINTRAAEIAPRNSKMSPRGVKLDEGLARAWGGLGEGLTRAWGGASEQRTTTRTPPCTTLLTKVLTHL